MMIGGKERRMKAKVQHWFIAKNLDPRERRILDNHVNVEIVGQTEKAYLLEFYTNHDDLFSKWFPKSVITIDGEPDEPKRPERFKKELNGVFGSEGLNRIRQFLESWGVPIMDIQSDEEGLKVIEEYGLMNKWNEEKKKGR